MKINFSILAVAALFSFCHVAMPYAAEPFARAIAIEGEAHVQKSGSSDWIAMNDGMEVDSGDVIKTAKNTEVTVTYDKDLDNVLRIMEDSIVTLRSQEIDVPKGRILARLDSLEPGTSFVATTPSAIGGVRGSAFGVKTDGGTSEVLAYEHDAFAKGLDSSGEQVGDEVIVPEGMKTTIQQGNAPGTPYFMSLEEASEFQDLENDLSELSTAGEGLGGVSPTISPSGQ
jgi:hypothetical protein